MLLLAFSVAFATNCENRFQNPIDMIYKFDILFRKTLSDGTIKVVTYRSLAENPMAFGQGETLKGAVGELSLVKEGVEEDSSINSLMRKYRSQLIGRMNAEIFSDDFPMRFCFADGSDVSSIRVELKDENGYVFSSQVQTRRFVGNELIDLSASDAFVCFVCKEGSCILSDDEGNESKLGVGELAFCSADTKELLVVTTNLVAIEIRHLDRV